MANTRFGRKDRLIKQKRIDAYQQMHNPPEPTVCSKCQALFANGRWTWKPPPSDSNESTCPACRRIIDNYPAGFITIKGEFYILHRDNILNLVKNVENQEKRGRPLERIMNIDRQNDQAIITTTGIHVARRIGEALSKSFKGDLSIQYADADKNVRVNWSRES